MMDLESEDNPDLEKVNAITLIYHITKQRVCETVSII
jgi:hypothetical protein